MAQKTSIKNPPQPYEDKATRRERARFKKMKAEMDEGLAKRMSQPLQTEVMTRPGSKKPLPAMGKRNREKKYSFGALEKDKDLSLGQYREKAGRDPMSYNERKTKEVFASLDAASAAGIPHLAALGGKAVAGLVGGRLVAGRAATEAGKEAGKKFIKQGGEKFAEKEAKDKARLGKETDILERPSPQEKPRMIAFDGSTPLIGAKKGPPKKRKSLEEFKKEQAIAERQKKAKKFDTRPSV